MTKREKLVALIQARPVGALYRDVEKLLAAYNNKVVREALTDICDRLGLTD